MVCLLPRASRAVKRNKYKKLEDLKKSDTKENLRLALRKYFLDVQLHFFFPHGKEKRWSALENP